MTFITVSQAAEMLHVSQDTVRAWVRLGKVPSSRIGRRILINQEGLEACLSTNHRIPPTGTSVSNGLVYQPFADQLERLIVQKRKESMTRLAQKFGPSPMQSPRLRRTRLVLSTEPSSPGAQSPAEADLTSQA